MGVFSDAEMTQSVTGTLLTSGPGGFEITNLTPGSYYMRGYLDVDGNSQFDMGEPFGASPNNPIVVQSGMAANAGIIVLTGVTNEKRRNEYPIHQRPDLIYSSLLELSKEYEKR